MECTFEAYLGSCTALCPVLTEGGENLRQEIGVELNFCTLMCRFFHTWTSLVTFPKAGADLLVCFNM